MTTHHDIFGLILGETCGAQRDDVLQALCAAFCACYDNEQGDERPVDCEVLSDEAAHLYFVDCYYKALATDRTSEYRGSERCHLTRELTRDQILGRIRDSGGVLWHEPPVPLERLDRNGG